jgi:hypothetical protein
VVACSYVLILLVQCGDPSKYCPMGSAAPVSMANRTDDYTVPGSGANATTQTGIEPCPVEASCAAGQIVSARSAQGRGVVPSRFTFAPSPLQVPACTGEL